MIVYPKAKINIGLRVIEKRPDGFHDLETFFFPAELSDILEVRESDKLAMFQYGTAIDSLPEDNICIKAYNAIKADFNLPPVEIHLYKRIPVGAGLGGGSSDAANTLIALKKLFSLAIDEQGLAQYAAKVGSDCPFFIYSSSLEAAKGEGMLAYGRGELLTKITVPQLEGMKIKVEKPPVFVSTAEAYKGVTPKRSGIGLQELLSMPLDSWKNNIVNDFEESILKKYPIIEEYKNKMYEEGAIYASMSGSGSAVFGIFR
jgi:4-diphosphocytidyl-2-C-methyl-D-erythritol kinase